MKKINKKYLTVTILWMSLIFYLSSQTGGQSGGLSSQILVNLRLVTIKDVLTHSSRYLMYQSIIRTGAHFTEYFILGILLVKTFTYKKSICIKTGVIFLIGALYAVSDEIHQYFVPERSMQFEDVFIDIMGVLVGIYFCKMFNKNYK
ncbi:MAG: VanZ family protein [Eubacteriaceae bacterium]